MVSVNFSATIRRPAVGNRAKFRAGYDEEIKQAQDELSAEDLREFRQGQWLKEGDDSYEYVWTKRNVLTIVLAYLYSRREPEA